MNVEYPNCKDNNRYSVAQASRILGISESTLRDRIRDKQIRVKFRKVTGRMFIEGSEINRFWKAEL